MRFAANMVLHQNAKKNLYKCTHWKWNAMCMFIVCERVALGRSEYLSVVAVSVVTDLLSRLFKEEHLLYLSQHVGKLKTDYVRKLFSISWRLWASPYKILRLPVYKTSYTSLLSYSNLPIWAVCDAIPLRWIIPWMRVHLTCDSFKQKIFLMQLSWF